jgi:diguanylate cyclase (GGDEF)-like protein
VAARICESVRHGDTVGRTGGDEILVVLPDVHSIDEVARIGEEIRLRAAEPIHESGATLHVTLSIGATVADPGESVSSITARADAAMYQAKSSDRNTVIPVEAARLPRPPLPEQHARLYVGDAAPPGSREKTELGGDRE